MEDDKKFFIEIEAPGFDEKELEINLEDNQLILAAASKSKKEQKTYGSRRSFSKSYVLPERADLEKISATYKQGILSIVIPKIKIEPRKIKISVST